MTIYECAEDIAYHPQSIRRLIQQGKLKAEKVGLGFGRWDVSDGEWKRFCEKWNLKRGMGAKS